MIKYLALSAALACGFAASAQSLEEFIPANSVAVGTIRSGSIFKLMALRDFDRSSIVKKILEKSNDRNGLDYGSIADFGINLQENFYYFRTSSDSVSYNGVWMPLIDEQKFERFAAVEGTKIERIGKINRCADASDNTVWVWDSEKALYLNGDLNYSFFENDSIASRYGMPNLDNMRDSYLDRNYDYDDAEATTVDTVSANEPEEVDMDTELSTEVYDPSDDVIVEIAPPPSMPSNVKVESPRYLQDEETTAVMDIPYTTTEEAVNERYEESEYDKAYTERKNMKDSIVMSWTKNVAMGHFNKPAQSILTNRKYVDGRHTDAVASVWIPNLSSLYGSAAGLFGLGAASMAGPGFGSYAMDMYMDKQQMRIETSTEPPVEWARPYERILDQKINRKFYKYINSNTDIGYMSYAMNTKNYLEEFPKMIEGMYSYYLMGERGDTYRDEIALGTELFGILLDEEAVANVIKGDALFVINGISEHELKYTSYDYDNDSFEETEVQKVKTESLPDFLFMFTSDDMSLLRHALRLGVKRNYLTEEAGIYTLVEKDIPINVFLTMKDGIVFLANNERDILAIKNDSYRGNLSREDKKLIKKSNLAMVFHPQRLAGKIKLEEENPRDVTKFNNTLRKMNKITVQSHKPNNGIIAGTLIAEVPPSEENALYYFFSLMNEIDDL